MESLTRILFDFDKLPSKLLLIICFLSSIILFVPSEFLIKLKLDTFNSIYGHWVGIAFIGSISFLSVTLVTTIQRKLRRRAFNKSIEADIRKSMHRLDPMEQSILREFYLVGSTVNLPMDNATVVGLQDKHIIRLAQSNLGGSYFVSGDFGMPFVLTDFARSVIENNITMIGIPQPVNNSITDDQRHDLAERRPPWIRRDFY